LIARLKRLTDRDWDFLDRALAVFLSAVVVLNITLNHKRGPLVLDLLIGVLVCAALLFRRKHPLLMAAVVISGAATLLGVLISPQKAGSVVFAVIVASYSTGRHLELRRAVLGLVMFVAGIATASALKTPTDIFFPLVFFGILPWAVGRVIRNQTALARELSEKAEREQFAREQEEARATAGERARVARELHDVLAHNLSVMVIQASAARRIADQDPAAAIGAAELISRTGREALSELRYVFGPVRKGEDDVLGSSPGLANLDKLAARVHRAGLPVDLRVEGDPLQLSPGADMAAYRVVQEALTNSLKHAHGTRATVVVRYDAREVTVEVRDDGRGAVSNGRTWDSGGHGLIGMRERVALYGGKLEAGYGKAGGFAVRARIPVEQVLA
jgi:signal transduction histidine kinase